MLLEPADIATSSRFTLGQMAGKYCCNNLPEVGWRCLDGTAPLNLITQKKRRTPMSESDGASEIIIKGGSVKVHFDDAGYTSGPGGNHENASKRITKIVVKDDKDVE